MTLPIYALNAASEERCEWLVPGMLKDKLVALARTLPQRPRSRLVPLPEFAEAFIAASPFGDGSLIDTLVADAAASAPASRKRADFKHEQLSPHLLMNLRVVDEHGRQLGESRHLAELKAELGAQARSAFQALAALRLPTTQRRRRRRTPTRAAPAATAGARCADARPPRATPTPRRRAGARYTAWTFGELPELMELRQGGQSLIGYPALIDKGTHVEIEVFDEPESPPRSTAPACAAWSRCRCAMRSSISRRTCPTCRRWRSPTCRSAAPRSCARRSSTSRSTAPSSPIRCRPMRPSFARRIDEGRGRLTLIANEVARLAGACSSSTTRRSASSRTRGRRRTSPTTSPRSSSGSCPSASSPRRRGRGCRTLPRYLKAIAMRLDKLRADPARDAARLAELRPLEQRYLRKLAERRGARDARLDEFRWWLEELRVGLFAQELKTPQPVSVKRLEKIWAQAFA